MNHFATTCVHQGVHLLVYKAVRVVREWLTVVLQPQSFFLNVHYPHWGTARDYTGRVRGRGYRHRHSFYMPGPAFNETCFVANIIFPWTNTAYNIHTWKEDRLVNVFVNDYLPKYIGSIEQFTNQRPHHHAAKSKQRQLRDCSFGRDLVRFA